MSNSFNISVKPEIAAVEAKVDIIDTEVDAVRSTDIPGTNTKLDANKTVIDSNATNIGDIINTAIPNVITEIDANETKIDTIDGIVDAIKLKTDATPQVIRGQVYNARSIGDSDVLSDVVNVTGQGKLYKIVVRLIDGADTVEVKLTLDGKFFSVITYTGDTANQVIFPSCDPSTAPYRSLVVAAEAAGDVNLSNIEFDTSLLVEYRRSAGVSSNVICSVLYTLDLF